MRKDLALALALVFGATGGDTIPTGPVQEIRTVRGGFVACRDGASWSALESLRLAGNIGKWNKDLRKAIAEGQCLLTEPGQRGELAGSKVRGAVLLRFVQPEMRQQSKQPPVWLYVSPEAIRDG